MCMTKKQLKTDIQYFVPKHILTRLVGFLTSAKLGKFTTFLIEQFVKFYRVNTEEMSGKIEDYKTFNDFFARPLKPEARPIDSNKDSLVFPVDGTISRFAEIKEGMLIQAKNHYYTAEALLGGEDGKTFNHGQFITIYLSPKDYHRVHIPVAGKLQKMIYIPGDLFSVCPFNAEQIPELFSRNERVVCLFDTAIGQMAVVLVGAVIVRSITTVWEGVVAPNNSQKITVFDYSDKDIVFEKGDEIGYFSMGSTVVCLFEKDKIEFLKNLEPAASTRMGEKMGDIKK